MEFTEMETETHLQSPPTSLVPRLHVIFADKICHNNPLLSPEIRRAVGARDQNENQDEKKNDGKLVQSSKFNQFVNKPRLPKVRFYPAWLYSYVE